MKVEAIRVWGDSILKGIVFDSARKRYTIIKDNALSLLSEKVVTPIQNFSRMGATAPEALKALKAKLADASLENQIVVFEVGGNDCDFDWKAVADTPEAEQMDFILSFLVSISTARTAAPWATLFMLAVEKIKLPPVLALSAISCVSMAIKL